MKKLWTLFVVLPLAGQPVPDRYIVELSGEPAISVAGPGPMRSRESAMQAARISIQAEQERARANIEAGAGEVLASVDTVANALIVRSSPETAQRLASIPGVKRVYRVWQGRALLNRAVVLHHIADAWNRLPDPGAAGAGVKIGIIDSGIDPDNAGFQDPALEMPSGFPLPAGKRPDGFEGKNKIIVARSYESLYGKPDRGPRDTFGHGTGVAMAAAGARTAAPLADISGAAPKAWIGVYRVFPTGSESFSTDVLLKALDDAVKDGMDIVNLSLGIAAPLRPAADPLYDAVERASAAGVIVVAAAGNEGPLPNSMTPPATAPSAVAVGAGSSDRMLATSLQVQDGPGYASFPGDGPWPVKTITGPLLDVAQLDPSGLACDPLPAGSLTGKVALILRGVCYFRDKIDNAGAAGAIAAVIYTDGQRPALVRMATGTAKLPAQSLSYADGIDLKGRLKDIPDLTVSLTPGPIAVPLDPNKLAIFSSAGPNPDESIKPDLVAVGTNLYTATETSNDQSTLYEPSGYRTFDGTSFSSPLVAGALAVLKSARPGLTVGQYRSLLINAATPFVIGDTTVPVQRTGAGLLNLDNAMRSTLAVAPTSVSFGVGGGTFEWSRQLSVTNLGAAADTLSVTAAPAGNGPAPVPGVNTLTLDPGATGKVGLKFAAASAQEGEYQGYFLVRGTQSDVEIRVPYWYAVASSTPVYVRIIYSAAQAAAGATVRNAVIFQVTDASGIGLATANPRVAPLEGGGRLRGVYSADIEIPGGYIADVVLGRQAGNNVFQIDAGGATATFTIQGIR